MPPKGRPSKSPAKERPTPAPKPTKSPAKSPGRGAAKSPAKAKPASNGGAEVKEEAPAPVPAPEEPVAAAPEPATPAAKAPSNLKSIIPLGVFGLVVAIGVVLASSYPTSDPPKIPKISDKVFDGKTLRGVKGSALIIFKEKSCPECKELNKVINTPTFKSMAEGWKRKDLLKMGKVICDDHLELCERFGVAGDEESASGYPNIVHFKEGKEVGGYDGERTEAGFKAWVEKKKKAGEL